jgi:glycyl-tRNA synthetase
MVGVHDRQSYDLERHEKYSKKKLRADGEIPHILEIAFGSDRPTFALIDLFLDEDKIDREKRIVLKLPKNMAPIPVAVFPLMKKGGLSEKAEEVYDVIKGKFTSAFYDEAGSIGKRYRRMDEVGTPYCVTIDYDTLKDNTVTVRDRDSMKQKRIKIDKLVNYLYEQVSS